MENNQQITTTQADRIRSIMVDTYMPQVVLANLARLARDNGGLITVPDDLSLDAEARALFMLLVTQHGLTDTNGRMTRRMALHVTRYIDGLARQ